MDLKIHLDNVQGVTYKIKFVENNIENGKPQILHGNLLMPLTFELRQQHLYHFVSLSTSIYLPVEFQNDRMINDR